MPDPHPHLRALAALAAIGVAASVAVSSCGGSGSGASGAGADGSSSGSGASGAGADGSSSASGGRGVNASHPCGTASPKSASYTHVVWIWLENRSYDQVIGSPEAPYLTQLGHRCGIAANYHNVTHPSLPNYIAATSGLGYGAIARFGSDCNPSRSCSTQATSVFDQAPSWRAYEESMPGPCARDDAGLYAARHNPPLYYRDLRGCRENDVPFTELAGDLAEGSLPAFSFITPNLCNDTHDCSVSTGDRWLAERVPAILGSSVYRDGKLVLVITYDEGFGSATSECASNRTSPDCHIATVVVSPSTQPGTVSRELFNHYSLLRTTESLLGLPYLGRARSAPSMAAAFGLGS